MINSVSVSRRNADFSQRVARSNTPASVLTDAVKSYHPAQGEHLFQQVGDESREQFLSSTDNLPNGDAADIAQLAASAAKLTKSLQARFAKAATNPKRFHSLMKQAQGEKYDADAVEALLQQANDGDFSWLTEFTTGAEASIFAQLFSNENIDIDPFTASQNEPDGASNVANNHKRGFIAGLVKNWAKAGVNTLNEISSTISNTIDEKIAQPIQNGVDRLGSWGNETINQPVKYGAQRFGSWSNEYIAQPIKNTFESVKNWTSENIAQPVKQSTQKLRGWIGEKITQPVKNAAKQTQGFINDNVLQPINKAGGAAVSGTKTFANKTAVKPVQQVSKAVQGSLESIKNATSETFTGIRASIAK